MMAGYGDAGQKTVLDHLHEAVYLGGGRNLGSDGSGERGFPGNLAFGMDLMNLVYHSDSG